ncbi:MAG: hypothetical protein KJN63_02750, partial [Acidimicrobiia bacterium]|nr:hypothetical protein [Acidimicrobiia bacterium]
AGCRPVLPNDFSYPEVIAGQAELYVPGSFGTALEHAVNAFDPNAAPLSVARFDWAERIDDYDARILALVGR